MKKKPPAKKPRVIPMLKPCKKCGLPVQYGTMKGTAWHDCEFVLAATSAAPAVEITVESVRQAVLQRLMASTPQASPKELVDLMEALGGFGGSHVQEDGNGAAKGGMFEWLNGDPPARCERGTPLTPEDVRDRVAGIAACVGDNEAAHQYEDRLWGDVLRAIEAGCCEDPAGCAREALRTIDIEFDRWYA